MVQCEMCGSTTGSPKTVKVEGAELQVCDDCADFGTEVRTESAESTSSTKYSTSSGGSSGSSTGSSGSSGGTTGGSTSSGGGGGSRRSDMFDDLDEIAGDYDDRIRRAREEEGLSQADLADELNEKASLIRKLERGETLPSDDVQSELERHLGINLSAAAGAEDTDTEWEGSSEAGEYTLGDVVKRKD